jgi:hypothetical protein
MNILLGDINAKVGREEMFKLTTGNKSLDEISTDNGVRYLGLIIIQVTTDLKLHKFY